MAKPETINTTKYKVICVLYVETYSIKINFSDFSEPLR